MPFSEEWLRVSRKPSPRLMVPLSFLINTWPWARLPSLLCHEGPIIYDLGVSHRPWQGANGSGPNVFFHSVANEGGACKFCRQNDCVGIFSDAPPGLAVNLFPGGCSWWSLAAAGRLGGGPSRLPTPIPGHTSNSVPKELPQFLWGFPTGKIGGEDGVRTVRPREE